MLPLRRGARRAQGELGQREQQHSEGMEVPAQWAGTSLQRGRARWHMVLSPVTSVGPYSLSWSVPSVGLLSAAEPTGHAGPSPDFMAAQIRQRLHLIALCL